MSSLCIFVMMVLSTAFTGPATNASAPAGTTASSGERAVRTARAAQLFESGRYVEAALEFEDLHAAYPDDPAILFNASASRDAAGHYGHAVAYVRGYLARTDIGPDDRKQGEEQLDHTLGKVTAVTVTVRLPLEGPRAVTLVARHVTRSPSDLRPDLRFPMTASPQVRTLELDPDAWVVRVEGPGYRPTERQVTVGSTPMAVTLEPALIPMVRVVPRADGAVPPAVVWGATRGLLIGGGVVAATGLGVLVGGVAMVQGVKVCTDPLVFSCRKKFSEAFVVRNVGASLFGAGAGVIAGGLVWRLEQPRRRTIAWGSLAAIGGVGLLVGEILVVRGMAPFSRDNTDPMGSLAGWPDHWSEHRRSALPALAATLRGLGVGFVASAVTGLIVQRTYRVRPGRGSARTVRVDPSVGPGQTGVMLSGRF